MDFTTAIEADHPSKNDILEIKENPTTTRYMVTYVDVSTNEVRKKCVKCGRIRIFYCKDDNFNYCDNCGRKILFSEDLQKIYGKTVLDFVEHLDPCRHCPHFDEDEFKCDKIHHCDCDCPECSPESYV